MDQNSFRNTLRKYLQDEASSEERKLVDDWYGAMAKTSPGDEAADEADPEHFGWAAIDAHVKKSKKRERVKKILPWYIAGLAASILLLIVSSALLQEHNVNGIPLKKSPKLSLASKDIVNTTKLTQVIVLPDSSRVALEPDGRLKFSNAFNKTEREVYLEGEAFFNVTHNANIPFTVHANEVITKVLGTSFIIKALKHDNKITVVVKTGKVSVFTRHEEEEKTASVNEIILTPNQQIIYDKNQKELSKMIVDTPQAILPEEEIRRMRFEEAPVSEIFQALEKTFGVDIDFDEELFSTCRLTTVISKDDLYDRLNIICNVIGTSYTVQGERIVISSGGCKAKMN